MFENFKSDIIYYKTQTDFELEFNLSGCYRKMRLLHDKCSDKKTLLLSLSRAVSRSRIIIITAPLFSDENITGIVASAIGADTEIINNKDYNINSNAEITVIKNSVPLVTSDGFFGGCIIESGPQSLILLTDNKNIRKDIMKQLIHPYVEEFANMQSENSIEENTDEEILTQTAEDEETQEPENSEIPQTSSDDAELDAPENDEIIIKTDEDDDDEGDETNPYETEDNELVVNTNINEEIIDDDYYKPITTDLFTDPDIIEFSDAEEKIEDQNIEDESDYFTKENEEPTSPFGIWFVIITVLLLVAIAVLCFCIFYIPTKAGLDPSEYIKDIINTMFGKK